METYLVAYLRVSGQSQVESLGGNGFDRQEKACTALAASLGLEIKDFYKEEAVPGWKEEDERPAFKAMMDTLLPGTYIVIESLDRLARSYRVQEQLLMRIIEKGLELYAANTGECITESFMADPMRRALIQIQGIFAELDKNLLVAKLRKGIERTRAKTGRCEGRKPYGAKGEERPILDIILDANKGGINSDQIALHINKCGFLTRSGRPWRGSTIRKILQANRISETRQSGIAIGQNQIGKSERA